MNMKTRRDIFQAIADPTRRSILVLLATQELTAGAIAEKFGSARSTVSKHVQILQECGMKQARPHGREIHFQLRADAMDELHLWLQAIPKTSR